MMKNDYSFIYENMKQEKMSAFDEQKKKESKELFLKMAGCQNYEMSDMQFLTGQCRFIKKRTWFMQLAVLIAAMLYMKINCVNYVSAGKYLTVFATLTPFLLISQIEEIVKVYTNSMIEVEMSTKFSLSKLVTARMSILGIADMVALMIWMGFCAVQMDTGLYDTGFSFYMILYGLVPYNITLICYFTLLTYGRKEHFTIAAFMTTASVMLIYYCLCIRNNYIYNSNYMGIWVAVYVISLVGFVLIAYRHKKQIQKQELLLDWEN